MWISRLLSSLGKVLFASLITGTVLAALGISTKDIFPGWAGEIDKLTDAIELALNWAVIYSVPNILIGAIIIVPVWFILIAFGPKN